MPTFIRNLLHRLGRHCWHKDGMTSDIPDSQHPGHTMRVQPVTCCLCERKTQMPYWKAISYFGVQ